MSRWFDELTRASNAELERLLRQGVAPDLPTLVSREYRGLNTGPVVKMLGIQKFIKGFFEGPAGVEGYNIRVRQNGPHSPWIPLPTPEAPVRFGFFLVAPVNPDAIDNRYPHALLLDYGASPRNARWRIERILRDYLVVPDPAQPEVLLGKAYLALGGSRIEANFFILELLRLTESRQ